MGLAQALTRVTASQPAVQKQAMNIPARAEQQFAPLSLMQQRLWFLENMNPGTPFNQLPSAHRLLGTLNVDAFRLAFAQLVARQSALRTVIERTPQEPRQRVLTEFDASLGDIEDLRSVPAEQRETVLQSQLQQLTLTPLDHAHGPLFSVKLFQLGDQEHVFFFMVHHFIWDGSSFDVLYHELAELYAANSEQRPPQLPHLPISYGDYATWQLDWMQSDELTLQTKHWVEALSPLPLPLDLPTDRPRPAEMSGKGESCSVFLSADLSGALHALARNHGCTLSTVLLSTYGLLLH